MLLLSHIISLMQVIEELPEHNILFVAVDMNRIPSVKPDEVSNLVSLATRMTQLEFKVKQLQSISEKNKQE